MIHLRLTNPPNDRLNEEMMILTLVEKCIQRGVGITASKFALTKKTYLPPTIRICASTLLTQKQIKDAVKGLKDAIKETLNIYA